MRHLRDHDIYAEAPMRRLREDEMRAVAPDLQRCFGTHALLIGTTADDVPPVLPLLGCWVRLLAGQRDYRGDLRASTDEPLPFVDDVFDLVILRHAQEVVGNASALLAEAARVLAPGGVLVVTGVHPVSGWAPWFCWRARSSQAALRSPWRLRQALRQAGLEMEQVRRVGHTWPVVVAGPAVRNPWGGGYVLSARKRRHGVLPLRIKTAPVRVPAGGRLSPGTRRHSAL